MRWGHFKPDPFILVFIVFLGACAQAHVRPQQIEPCTAFVEVLLLSQGMGRLIAGGKLWTSLKITFPTEKSLRLFFLLDRVG